MLQKAGPEAVHHYLAVLPAGRTPVGPHVPHLVVTGSLPVRHNSAEVLVLAGRARWQAIRWGNLRHARWVILRWDVSLAALVALVALLWHAVRGKLSYAGRVALGELPHRRWCFSFAARRPAQHRSARRYVPFAWGIAGFLHQLAQAQVRHVVLRWFETLPTLPPGEDLDLLVADEDLSKVEALLDAAPGVFPCDLYSVSGLPGTDLDGLPYFPPFLAQQIIDTARPHPSGARVPDPQRHFLSLAYHVVYHKGPSSGLPPGAGSIDTPQRPDHAQALSRFAWSAMRTTDSSCGPARRVSRGRGCTAVDGEHDYAGVLNQLAAQLGWPLQPTLRSLDTLLAEQGWRPPRDMLLRLARRRPFLRTLLDGGRSQEAPPGLAVFILRQAAVVDQACDRLIDLCGMRASRFWRSSHSTLRERMRPVARCEGAIGGRGRGRPVVARPLWRSWCATPNRSLPRRVSGEHIRSWTTRGSCARNVCDRHSTRVVRASHTVTWCIPATTPTRRWTTSAA